MSADEFLAPDEIEEALAAMASPGYAERFDLLGVKLLRTVDGSIRVWMPKEARPHFEKLVAAVHDSVPGQGEPSSPKRSKIRRRDPIPEEKLVQVLRSLDAGISERKTADAAGLDRHVLADLRKDRGRGLGLDKAGRLTLPAGSERTAKGIILPQRLA